MKGAPEDLSVWLKERKQKSEQEAADLTDNYTTAGRGESLIRPHSSSGNLAPTQILILVSVLFSL